MRLVGRISGWNEDKGYGFVIPHDGGARAFVHIKAFQFGSRRPIDGDLISYSVFKDDRGRTNAIDVRFAGQKIEQRRPPRSIPRLAIGVLFLLAATLGTFFGVVPSVITIGYVLLSYLSYMMYSLDKAAAKKEMQRTPESTLHSVDLLGGWPGALIAQQQFRHKTVKTSFQSVFWVTVLVNVAVVVWLVRSGIAQSFITTLHGG
jgi:Predicted membrane protein